MTTQWVRLPAPLAWVVWRALCKAEWSAAAQWRERFLAFERPDQVLSRDLVEHFLREVASPRHLVDLCEELLAEKRLLRRDARCVEELLLQQTDRTGQWKHHHGKGESV
jgi:hypothetical protein